MLAVVILAIGMLTAAVHAESEPIRVILRPAAALPATDVRIGDVAEVKGGIESERAGIEATVLGMAPPPGERAELSRAFVGDFLSRRGWTRARLTVGGAGRTILTPMTTTLAGDVLLTEGLESLREAFGPDTGACKIDVSPGTVPPSVVLPAGRSGVTTEYRIRSEQPRTGTTYVDAALLVDGRPYRIVSLPYHVRVVANVLTTTAPIRRDEPFGPHNLRIEEREITRLVGHTALSSFEEVEGLLARRTLRPGEIVDTNTAYRPHAVRRGDPVVLVLREGVLTVTTKGVAGANGHLGQEIPVKNARSGRTVFGRVIDAKTVEVTPLGRRITKGSQP
jgi:flagella basal body P-ring formation protein FlgA